MTSHGGLEGFSQKWVIAADGSWTVTKYTQGYQSHPPTTTTRSGQLTAVQQHEVAGLAADPALHYELTAVQAKCTISDGPTERFEMGSVEYRASWCREYRPLIARIRARIAAFTIGD